MEDLQEIREEVSEFLKVPVYTVADFLAVCNEVLEYSFSSAVIVGEVASFKINQGKWVFFDLKDEDGTVPCFLPVWELRAPIEDGMKIVVKGCPKLTKLGKFSIIVKQIRPVGEGNLKKSFELLKKKLAAEGLFDISRKRGLPEDLSKIGVISSTQAAGYADFCKILNARWGGLSVYTAHTQVQGLEAADQIIRALKYFNEQAQVDVIAIIRGGGSADDLAVFNDEKLVREIAASRIPVITGIGHEVDESLADMVADVRASTPSNVAEMLTPDREAEKSRVETLVTNVYAKIIDSITTEWQTVDFKNVGTRILSEIERACDNVEAKQKMLGAANPDNTLKRGYAIVTGDLSEGSTVKVTTYKKIFDAKINNVKERK